LKFQKSCETVPLIYVQANSKKSQQMCGFEILSIYLAELVISRISTEHTLLISSLYAAGKVFLSLEVHGGKYLAGNI